MTNDQLPQCPKCLRLPHFLAYRWMLPRGRGQHIRFARKITYMLHIVTYNQTCMIYSIIYTRIWNFDMCFPLKSDLGSQKGKNDSLLTIMFEGPHQNFRGVSVSWKKHMIERMGDHPNHGSSNYTSSTGNHHVKHQLGSDLLVELFLQR